MGRPKATLPFGSESMAVRVARAVGSATSRLVIVAAAGQPPPEFPFEVSIVHDRHPDRGPLEGLAVGLRTIAGDFEQAFVAGCDLPLLKPAFVRRMIELSADFEICLPVAQGRHEPMAAVYRTSTLPEIEALLVANQLRPRFLLDRVRTRRVSAEELADVDPGLSSLTNVNDVEQYWAALSEAGLKLPPDNG